MTGFAVGQSLRARLTASIGLGAIVAVSSLGQALAATSWTDPIGDALFHAPAYADILAGSVEENAGTFEFTLTVADVIPQTPRLTPPGVQGYRWVASLDLDPTSNPVGWPTPQRLPAAPQSSPAAAEAFVAVAWDGSAFSATLFDRRPLLSGGDVVATSVPFEIDGDTVHIWLDGALIGDPTSFRVGFVTVALTTKLGTIIDQKQLLDVLQPFYNPWP
jgi:hypothetical protein